MENFRLLLAEEIDENISFLEEKITKFNEEIKESVNNTSVRIAGINYQEVYEPEISDINNELKGNYDAIAYVQ